MLARCAAREGARSELGSEAFGGGRTGGLRVGEDAAVLTAVLFGLAASSALVIGALVGGRWSPPKQVTGVPTGPAHRSAPAAATGGSRVLCPPDRCPLDRDDCGLVTAIIPAQRAPIVICGAVSPSYSRIRVRSRPNSPTVQCVDCRAYPFQN